MPWASWSNWLCVNHQINLFEMSGVKSDKLWQIVQPATTEWASSGTCKNAGTISYIHITHSSWIMYESSEKQASSSAMHMKSIRLFYSLYNYSENGWILATTFLQREILKKEGREMHGRQLDHWHANFQFCTWVVAAENKFVLQIEAIVSNGRELERAIQNFSWRKNWTCLGCVLGLAEKLRNSLSKQKRRGGPSLSHAARLGQQSQSSE